MSRRRAPPGTAAREIEIGLGPILLALVVIGGLVAVAGWFVARRGGRGTVSQASPPAVVQPTSMPTPSSMERGTHVTAEGDPAIGSAAAPITIVEYADYQCSNCRQFAEEVLPWLKRTWMAQGAVRVVFRDFAVKGAESVLAAEAAHCAGEQGRYWSFHDALFAAQSGENEGTFKRDRLVALAGQVGLDADALGACVDANRHRARVAAATQAALGQGFAGTPTFLVNGHKTQGAIPTDRWDELFKIFFSEEFARATATAASGG